MDFMTFGFGVLIDPRGGGAKGPKKGVRMIFFLGTRRFLNLTYRPMIISKETNLRKNSRKIVVLDLSISNNMGNLIHTPLF